MFAKTVVRCVFCVPVLTPTSSLFIKVGLLKLNELFELQILKLMQPYLTGFDVNHISFTTSCLVHLHGTVFSYNQIENIVPCKWTKQDFVKLMWFTLNPVQQGCIYFKIKIWKLKNLGQGLASTPLCISVLSLVSRINLKHF